MRTANTEVAVSVSTPDAIAVRRAARGLPPPSALLTRVLEAPVRNTQTVLSHEAFEHCWHICSADCALKVAGCSALQ